MSEEQKEILQMVSDGKISADDGAKLLDALTKGERKRREMESPATRAREKRRILLETKRMSPFPGLGNIPEMGRLMRNVMRDSMPGMNEDEYVDIDEDMYDDAGLLEGALELEEGTVLVLRRRIRRNSAGDLILNGVPGSKLNIVNEDESEVHLFRDNGTVLLKWDKGDLELNVPETVKNVRASIMGGDVILNGVTAVADIKTKGGDINLSEASMAFRVKTMGGDILISLTEHWNNDSKATTMGGNITLGISESIKASISAKTMGGVITVQDDIPVVTESGHPGASRVNIYLSDEEDAPELRVKTMGGNISIALSDEKPLEEKDVGEEEHQEKEKMVEDE
ncbi:MAG: DUF4097 family beta strand repeat protein [Candidatus Fermentibacteraceae bacterium]|nr:DUF4097 family beta strand repeat protein [Candidatus Fermentibacteraceae bacterium]